MNIASWLRRLGLGQYETAFADNAVDHIIIRDITAEDLKEIGVKKVGDRRKILTAIAAICDDGSENFKGLTSPPPTEAAERRQLTVLFCDLVGSTELSAGMDPEDMGALLRAVQGAIAAAAARYDGHVAKLMGDGALVYFGYPRAHEDDAERAVRAGLVANEAIRTIGRERDLELDARVGIATGLVVVGELIGSGEALERGVVGETPNLASRLQGLATPGSVVISASTRRLLGQAFLLHDLGLQSIKGLAEPTPAWSIVGEAENVSRFEATRASASISFIGRDQEVSLLMDRWSSAVSGEGQIILLSGEPGIGKSRILSTLQERTAVDDRTTVLRIQCSPYHSNVTLYPIIIWMRLNLDLASSDPINQLEILAESAKLMAADAVPIFAALLSISLDSRYTQLQIGPADLRERIIKTILALVTSRAAIGPALLLLEDAHWIDPTTLDVVNRLVDVVPQLRMLLVVTFRPEFAAPWVGRAHVTALNMNRFGRRHVVAMIDQLTGGKSLPQEVLEDILAKTDGVPLFVEELTKAVMESGRLLDKGDRYELVGPLTHGMIPSTLQDSLMARLDRIGSVKQIAQIGAAIGREFTHRLLELVSPFKGSTLEDAMRQLVASELIFERGSGEGKSYVFKHALVQDTAYNTLLRSRRQAIHGEIAKALVERFADDIDSVPAVIAHHYTEAGLTEPAARYWLASSEWALARSANAEADRYVEAALGLIARIEDGSSKSVLALSLQIAHANALSPLRGHAEPRTVAALTAAKRLLDDGYGTDLQHFSVLMGLCSAAFIGARMDDALSLAQEIIELARRNQDRTFHLIGLRSLASVLYFMGRNAEALQATIEGEAMRDPVKHRQISFRLTGDPSVQILCYKHLALFTLGYVDKSLSLRSDILTQLEGHPHAFTVAATTYMSVTWNTFLYDDYENAERAIQELVSYCTEARVEHFRLIGHVMQACIQALLRPNRSAVDAYQAALDAYARSGARIWTSVFLARLAEAQLLIGDIEAAKNTLDDSFSFVSHSKERYWLADLYRVRGLLLLTDDVSGDARPEESFGRGLEIAKQQEARLLELRLGTQLARLWRNMGTQSNLEGMLRPMVAKVIGGENCRDVKDARRFLDENPSQSADVS